MSRDTWKPDFWINIDNKPPDFVWTERCDPDDTVNQLGPRDKFLWGSVPPIDVIQLEKNEGVTHAETLRLLFAGNPVRLHAMFLY